IVLFLPQHNWSQFQYRQPDSKWGCPSVRAQSPSVRDVYDGKLSLQDEVNTFRHIDRVFPSATVQAGSHASSLPSAATQIRDVSIDIRQWVEQKIRVRRAKPAWN